MYAITLYAGPSSSERETSHGNLPRPVVFSALAGHGAQERRRHHGRQVHPRLLFARLRVKRCQRLGRPRHWRHLERPQLPVGLAHGHRRRRTVQCVGTLAVLHRGAANAAAADGGERVCRRADVTQLHFERSAVHKGPLERLTERGGGQHCVGHPDAVGKCPLGRDAPVFGGHDDGRARRGLAHKVIVGKARVQVLVVRGKPVHGIVPDEGERRRERADLGGRNGSWDGGVVLHQVIGHATATGRSGGEAKENVLRRPAGQRVVDLARVAAVACGEVLPCARFHVDLEDPVGHGHLRPNGVELVTAEDSGVDNVGLGWLHARGLGDAGEGVRLSVKLQKCCGPRDDLRVVEHDKLGRGRGGGRDGEG